MNFGIVLNEAELREMPPELRDQLLKWYFDRSLSSVGREDKRHDSIDLPVPQDGSAPVAPLREEKGRISFPDLVRAGLIAPGSEIVCKTLKRLQRRGGEQWLDVGMVSRDGSVSYEEIKYITPSKLAVKVINANQGNTKAVNGYDYLYVRSANGRLVPLSDLRDEYLEQIARSGIQS